MNPWLFPFAYRDFLKCLLNFSKIIVAGVKGDCIGLGVTMLPLFDMIVATDTASFCTPYSKVGCPPEAGFLLSIPYQSNHGLVSRFLRIVLKKCCSSLLQEMVNEYLFLMILFFRPQNYYTLHREWMQMRLKDEV